uniref:Uncharacterized protein n=1 Tax=Siphoviridae sp. ctepM7 TaxID=2826408 RepID=A0A8S5N8A7_9CAUD|nr:MAG TPA: hypothetical protein [Siphoviridae sp. ctepM7]DAV78634.1 MAG TPA: hypothetical protein [Caudoviricetes sp.]DAX86437.1 MAG TPA: hypothetical protein [Caudoviricetes sp.]
MGVKTEKRQTRKIRGITRPPGRLHFPFLTARAPACRGPGDAPEIIAILAYHVWLGERRTRKMAMPTTWRSESDHG